MSLLGLTENSERIEVGKSSRLQGTYVIGATGTGKSTLFENLIIQDIEQGLGVGLLDPHGDLVDRVIERLPQKRFADVILLDIANIEQVFGLNLFECHSFDSKTVQQRVDQVLHIFDLLYDVSRTTPMMAQTLRNASHTIIANKLTFAEIPLLLTNWDYRQRLLQQVKHQPTIEYWKRFDNRNKLDRDREIEATLNKLDEMLQPLTLNIIGQAKSTISLGEVMDERKILLVKLDARMPYMTSLIGSLLIAKVLNAAYDRKDVLPKHRKQFNLYADEFQRFATPDFAVLLTEARKYGIATTIAHQTREQLDRENKANSLQAANLIVFRVTGADAQEMASQFDATPEEAWEEELEQEWFERVEEEVIDGEEEIDTPVKDVVGHLLRGGTHPDPVVNEFARKWLLDGSEEYFQSLNRVLYDGMMGRAIWETYDDTILITLFNAAFNATYNPNIDNSGFSQWIYTLIKREDQVKFGGKPHNFVNADAYHAFIEYLKTGSLDTRDTLYDEVKEYIRKQQLDRLDFIINAEVKSIYAASTPHLIENQTVPPQNELDARQWQVNNFLKSYDVHMPEWFHIDVYKLDWQLRTTSDERYSVPNWGELVHYQQFWDVVPGQEHKFYREEDLEVAIDTLFEPARERFEECVAALEELKDVIAALAEHPLSAGSGIRQNRKRKQITYHTHPRKTVAHPQRSYSDRQGEVANRLASLPNFTAYVRLMDGEHRVGVARANQGISRTELNQRITDIIEQNVVDRYVRHREAVEKEITARQQPPADRPQKKQPSLADLATRPQSVADTTTPPPLPQARRKPVK